MTRHGLEALDFAQRAQKLRATGLVTHPLYRPQHKRIRVPQFISQYDYLKPEQTLDQPQAVAGRIASMRRAGRNLVFVDLIQDFRRVQVVVNRGKLTPIDQSTDPKSQPDLDLLRPGDHVEVVGKPLRTKAGELSILASQVPQLLSPIVHPLPTKLSDTTVRSHNRVLDMLVNAESKETIRARSTVISSIRHFLEAEGFLEVNTPILSALSGGASATPFTTQSKALGRALGKDQVELSLRVAPELWLKRLVVAGFDQVFELGCNFRNEGIDATHNPEFTSCEFYRSFATLDDLVDLTVRLLRQVFDDVSRKHPMFRPIVDGLKHELEDYQTLDFVDAIQAASKTTLPENLTTENLLAYCKILGMELDMSLPLTPAKILDDLAERYLEPQCTRPTFIMNHPHIMAPLAKAGVRDCAGVPRQLSRRFELFIGGRELVNAYEEENSPETQLANFQTQAGSDDVPDLEYARTLEWGLPPTAGWGLGIDRLVMMVTGAKRIAQVLPFGGTRTVNYQ